MQAHAMRIMAEFRIGLRQEIGANPAIERSPIGPGTGGLENAAARHADVYVRGVAWIDQDRMQLRAIGRAILIATAPLLAPRVRVESRNAFPRRATVTRAEQTLRRRSRVPHAG